MTRTPIIKNPEYLDAIKLIVDKNKIKSFELREIFIDKSRTNSKAKKSRVGKSSFNETINFSKKIQNIEQLGFIRKIDIISRGRHGKSGVYQIDWNGIKNYFFEHYILNSDSEFENVFLNFSMGEIGFLSNTLGISADNPSLDHLDEGSRFVKHFVEEALNHNNPNISVKGHQIENNLNLWNKPQHLDISNLNELFQSLKTFYIQEFLRYNYRLLKSKKLI